MKNDQFLLDHVLQSIELMEDYTKNSTIDEFLSEEYVQDAVIRRIKVISETVDYLSDDFKDLYLEIPWKTIANVKEILEKEEIDLELIWGTVEHEVPILKKGILKIIEVRTSY